MQAFYSVTQLTFLHKSVDLYYTDVMCQCINDIIVMDMAKRSTSSIIATQ